MPETVADFFRMGGYAFYVWSSYAIVFAVLALNVVVPALRHRRIRRAIARESRLGDDHRHEPRP